jgi:hypothetical protein
MQWHTNTLYITSRIQSYPMDFHNKKTIFTFPQSIWTFFENFEQGKPLFQTISIKT